MTTNKPIEREQPITPDIQARYMVVFANGDVLCAQPFSRFNQVVTWCSRFGGTCVYEVYLRDVDGDYNRLR